MRAYLDAMDLNNLRRLGFGAEDFANGGGDRLIDAIVAWGVEAVVRRVREHQAAGADHVCIQLLTADPRGLPAREWREIGAALCGA